MPEMNPLKRAAKTVLSIFLLLFLFWALGQDTNRNKEYRVEKRAIMLAKNATFEYQRPCESYCGDSFRIVKVTDTHLVVTVGIAASSGQYAYMIMLESERYQSELVTKGFQITPGLYELRIRLDALRRVNQKFLGEQKNLVLYTGLTDIEQKPKNAVGTSRDIATFLKPQM